MRHLAPAAVLLAVGIGAGCTLFRPVKGPWVPHPGQEAWVDEPAVMNLVARFVFESHFDRRRALAEQRYAALIRFCYTRASSGGKDLDGGRRAVNFIHKVHHDAGGSRDLWRRVMELARQPAPGEESLPLPPAIR